LLGNMLSLDIGFLLIRSQCRDLLTTTRGTMPNPKLFIQFIAISASIVGVIAMSAILSNYAGMVSMTVGSDGIQLQIKGDVYRK
jgi:hypothetical protein